MSITVNFDNGGLSNTNTAKEIKPAEAEPLSTEQAKPNFEGENFVANSNNFGADSRVGENNLIASMRQASAESAELGTFSVNRKFASDKAKGASFVKASSNIPNAKGIFTENNTVPAIKFDKADNRYSFPKGGEYKPDSNLLDELSVGKFGPLDRPSVYLGVNYKGQEVDAGLAVTAATALRSAGDKTVKVQTFTTDASGMNADNQMTLNRTNNKADGKFVLKNVANGKEGAVVYTADKAVVNSADKSVTFYGQSADGNKDPLTVYGNFAFTPFYRTAGIGAVDENGKKTGYADNLEKFTKGANGGNLQLFPGDKFNMSVQETKPGTITLDISSRTGSLNFGVSNVGKSNNPAVEYKRVDAIDQFKLDKNKKMTGNEGQNFIPTNVVADDGSWGKSYVTVGKSQKLFTADTFTRVVSKEFQDFKNFDKVSSENGKGRVTAKDGSEKIYNNPSRFFTKK